MTTSRLLRGFACATCVSPVAFSAHADFVIEGVGNGALDLPRVQAVIRPQLVVGEASAEEPFQSDLGDLFDDPIFDGLSFSNVLIEGFLDTGAGTVLIGPFTAQSYGMEDPDDPTNDWIQDGAVFEDVGIGGTESFRVSREMTMQVSRTSGSPANLDSNGDFVPSAFSNQYIDIRASVGESGVDLNTTDPLDLLLASLVDFNVFGMPTIDEKVMVMDGRGLNEFVLLDDNATLEDLSDDPQMRTHLYDKSTPTSSWNPNDRLNPGVPALEDATLIIDLDFANYSPATETTGGMPPSLAHNPMVGPAPSVFNETVDDRDNLAGITVSQSGEAATGSFLFDTGGSITVLSSAMLAQMGITETGSGYEDVNGDALETFALQVSGVGGASTLPGVILDELRVPAYRMVNGVRVDEDLVIKDVPIVVADIGLTDPNGDDFFLDGVFGMNLLFATTFLDGAIDPTLIDLPLIPGAFDIAAYDEVDNRLMLFAGLPVPEPASAALVLLGAGVVATRRRRR